MSWSKERCLLGRLVRSYCHLRYARYGRHANQHLTHRPLHGAEHGRLILELDLALTGVDIDIYVLWRDFEVYNRDGMLARHQQALVGLLRSISEAAAGYPGRVEE